MEVMEEEKGAIVVNSYAMHIITNMMQWQTLILGCITGDLWLESIHAGRFCHPLGKLHAVLTTLFQQDAANVACPRLFASTVKEKNNLV